MAEPPTPAQRLPALRRFAVWLDAGIPVPATGIRIGLDPILGLIPGLGDAVGAVLAAWILVEAARLGASRATLIRIAANVALDAGGGAIPILGDVFDVAWKANLRNVELLERHLAAPVPAQRADRLFVALVAGGIVALGLVLLVAGGILTAWLFRALAVG